MKMVEFKSMKGHAVVTIKSDKVKLEWLDTAVNGMKARVGMHRRGHELTERFPGKMLNKSPNNSLS